MIDPNELTPNAAKQQPEFKALSAVINALQNLGPEARHRVLASVATFLGLTPVPHQNLAFKSTGLGEAGALDDVGGGGHFSDDRTPPPKEFMFEKRPQTDIERIACLAYFLTHYRHQPHFKTLDLSKLNTEAAQLKLSNAAAAVDNATRAGLLVPATKGMKQLSAVGELYVQALPDRQAAKDAVAHAKPRKRGKRANKTPPISEDPE